jgi:hypothetical protein
LVPDDIAMDSRSSDGIKLGVFPHEPIQELFLEADSAVWQVLQLVDELVRDDEPLIVACLDNVWSIFVLR